MRGEFRNRKGQFTLVVILALLILIGVLLFVFYSNRTVEEQSRPELPPDVQPVRDFIDSCLEATAKEAVIKLGERGGYINPVEFGYTNNPFVESTDQSFVELAPNSEVLIPYWVHLESSNSCHTNCEFTSEAPPMYNSLPDNSIPSQISDYVEKNVEICLGNFETFSDTFTIKRVAPPVVTALIAPEKVLMEMDYPMIIDHDQEVRVRYFQAELDVDLKNAYDVAVATTQELVNSNLLEEIGINILLLNSFGEDPVIPPVAQGTEIGRGLSPRIWLKTNTEKIIDSELNRFMDRITMEGTGNEESPLTENRYENTFNSNLIIRKSGSPLQLRDYRNLDVEFSFLPWWGSYVDITGEGADEEVIVADPASFENFFQGLLMGTFLFQFQSMDYVYDWSFPVIIEFYEEDAFDGEGYTFRIAYEANIRNNRPMNLSFDQINFASPADTTRVCDRSTWSTNIIDIEARDTVNNRRVHDASISYKCGEETCTIGVTNVSGGLATKLPICTGGYLKARKLGFYGESLEYSTVLGMASTASISLLPEFDVKGEVQKKNMIKTGIPLRPPWNVKWDLPTPTNAVPLAPDEEAYIILSRISGPGQDPYTALVEYDITQGPQTFKLVPGVYAIQGTLLKNIASPFVIPQMTRSAGTLVFSTSYTLPDLTFNNVIPTGGVLLDEDHPIRVTASDLTRGKAVFYMSTVPLNLLEYHEDLQALSMYRTLGQTKMFEYAPLFVYG